MEAERTHNVLSGKKEKYMELWKKNEPMSKSEIYTAIKILSEMGIMVNATIISSTGPKNYVLMRAISHLYLLHSKTEETEVAEEQFAKFIHSLINRELEPEVILPMINALNQLGTFYINYRRHEEARVFLLEAEELYNDFKENVRLDPVISTTVDMEDIGDLSAKDFLEKLHIRTLDCLVDMYEVLDETRNLIVYHHKRLSKQLSLDKMTHDLDHIAWALTATAISLYYMTDENFPQTRYHLSAASYMLQKYRDILYAKEPGQNDITEYEIYHHLSADIATYWMNYSLSLMKASYIEYMNTPIQEDELHHSRSSIVDLTFPDIEPELETIIGQITDQYVLDIESARTLFLNILKWSDKAKRYYTLDNHTSDYVNIEFSITKGYTHMDRYEKSIMRTKKVLEQRISVYEDLVKKLNPKYHTYHYQNVRFWLGDMYADMLDITERLTSPRKKPTALMVEKKNRLVRRSIKYLRSYLGSLKLNESNDVIDESQVTSMYKPLYASFHIGELYDYLTVSDVRRKIKIMQNRLEAYQFVVTYYNKYPEEESEMRISLQKSRKLVNTLPLTLLRLRQQLRNQ